ncbi:hypothetical protein C5167_041694 [Papaver somniferum]|nr:hypothetical protein C5167_041694 [Papaver somniferum]
MEGNNVPNLRHTPRIPWKAQVREPVCGVNVHESERQSQGETDAQRREDQLQQRRILDKVKHSLMTEEERKRFVKKGSIHTYLRRKLARSGDEKKVVNEAETSAGQPHQGATRKADNTPSIGSTGGSEVFNFLQSPRISEQAQHRVNENIGTGMSTGNLGRHLKYRHPGYDQMGDAVSSSLPQPITAVLEMADKMGDAITSLLLQPITAVTKSAEKKADAVPTPGPQLVTSVTRTANTMSDAISSPLLPSITTVSKRDQPQVKDSSTTNFDLESCNEELTS